MASEALIQSINREFGLSLPERGSIAQLREGLSAVVNHLIQTDFNRLIQALYRIDVSESKLKFLLQENTGEDAATIIADLVIERQLQKINTRNAFNRNNDDISDEERW